MAKGESVGSATVRFYTRDSPYKPSNEAVLALTGEPALLFLTRVEYHMTGLNFAGDTPDALTRATDPGVAAVRAEVSRQTGIVASRPAGTMLPHFTEVRADRSSRSNQRQPTTASVDQLEALGEAAVPAIIAERDDRRALYAGDLAREPCFRRVRGNAPLRSGAGGGWAGRGAQPDHWRKLRFDWERRIGSAARRNGRRLAGLCRGPTVQPLT